MLELLILGIAVVVLIYYFIGRAQIKKLQADLAFYRKDILNAENEFKIEYDKNLYFSKQTLHVWEEKWKHIEPIVKRFCKMKINDDNLKRSILDVQNFFVNGADLIKKRNNAFIEGECEAFKTLFDTLECYPLTQSQRKSIITDEYNNLVVAGAGTGKTSTIVGKVSYVIGKGLAKPEEILLLAFTREARDEMDERISARLGVQCSVKTFHSLGLAIIADSEGTVPSVSDLSRDAQKLHQKIKQFIQRRIGLDQQQNLDDFFEKISVSRENDFLEKLTTYFVYHLRPYKSAFEFSSSGEYINYIKENQIRSLKGDIVKSYEECEIANFLYVNGIDYVYEGDYERPVASREHRQYQPDFYLPDYGIYIEHFGINRKGETAPYVDKDRYLREMAWKRTVHQKYGTKLIETFSYEKTEGTLLSNLEQALRRYNVKFDRIPNDQILAKINEMGVFIPFFDLLVKFLNLFKSSNMALNELRHKAKEFSDWQRHNAFLDIFERIYEDYTAYHQQTSKIDFNDMIERASQYLKKGRFTSQYKYILVDEFQDISQSRYRLLKGMLKNCPSCKSLCVGDDWQSIYRFTGSDLSIMTDFSKYFEFTEQMNLDQTFRLNDGICDFSSKFIMKNKDQIPKNLIPKMKSDSPAITLVWSKSGQIHEDLVKCLSEIESTEKAEASVFIIGRYHHLRPERLQEIQAEFPRLTVTYYTAHSSKGREADYVIVIGLTSGRFGFPCMIEDDPVLNLVLAKGDIYQNAEERRLFYVATTRAKKHVYLLTDPENPSSFINEILRDGYEISFFEENRVSTIHCPHCQTGLIVKKQGKQSKFYSCNNYPYCEYKAKTCPECADGFLYRVNNFYFCSNERCNSRKQVCPRCNDGYLVLRKKYTRFLGCSNYPRCTYTAGPKF